jgi:hypothetical protein
MFYNTFLSLIIIFIILKEVSMVIQLLIGSKDSHYWLLSVNEGYIVIIIQGKLHHLK